MSFPRSKIMLLFFPEYIYIYILTLNVLHVIRSCIHCFNESNSGLRLNP